jgi:hypothetical protein
LPGAEFSEEGEDLGEAVHQTVEDATLAVIG